MATVPEAPTTPNLSLITQTSVVVSFASNGNGGSPVIEFQIGYGTSSFSPQSYYSTGLDRGGTITGLSPAQTYYFWTRARNAIGWGPLSGSRSTRTVAGARIKVGSIWKEAIPYVRVSGIWKAATPWGRYAGIWKETE